MKKFMKAIAFVTVMCMALSTVAFADNSVPENAEADKTFIVTVTEADANDQVALMVVEAGSTEVANRDFSNPLYIDQKGVTDGVAEFTAKIAANVNAVDVFVGYAANELNEAVWVGRVSLVQPITEVTVRKIAADAIEDVEGDQQIGAGVWGEFSVAAPDGFEASQMIWAIRYTDPVDGPTVKYSDAIGIADYRIGNMVSGSVKLGFAFLNGFNRAGEEIDPVTITGVDAIFLFEGTVSGEVQRQEVVTNEDDWAKEDPYNKY